MAAALFVLAARHGFGAEQLTRPATATALASTALRDLNPWTGGVAERRARAVDLVKPLRALVAAVVTDPRNAWWSAPLDRDAQLLLTGHEAAPPDPMHLRVPTGPIVEWETYAQKPLHGIATSTELPVPATEPIRSGAHAQLACGVGDWDPTYPVRQQRLRVAPTARIYELTRAVDWHRLAVRYGDPATHGGCDPNLRRAAGIDNGLAPTWSAVAADYDGVHLTFAGLLTGLYQPVSTGGISTTLWAWEWESTHWLRSAFTACTPLPDLRQSPDDPDYHLLDH